MIDKIGIEDVKTGKEVICENIFDASEKEYCDIVSKILSDLAFCDIENDYRASVLIEFMVAIISKKEYTSYQETFIDIEDMFFKTLNTTELILDKVLKGGK